MADKKDLEGEAKGQALPDLGSDEESKKQAAPDLGIAEAPDLGAEEDIEPEEQEEPKKEKASKTQLDTNIFALRTTANREDQVMTFVSSNADRKGIPVYTVIRPHGMRGYIFLEAESRAAAEEAAHGIPYARGILPKQVEYSEIEHMLEQVKKEVNIQKNDIVEIISGAFKREKAKVNRVDKAKEEVVVELLEAAVPIPITLKIDAVKVIRRPGEDESNI